MNQHASPTSIKYLKYFRNLYRLKDYPDDASSIFLQGEYVQDKHYKTENRNNIAGF